MTVVRGRVSDLLVKPGVTSLVQAMYEQPSMTNAASCVNAFANDGLDAFHLYGDHNGDGGREDYNMACMVGEQVVVGAFPEYGIENGDMVKFIVSRINEEFLFAHSMYRMADGKLWMPERVKRGRIALIKSTAWMVMWGNAAMLGLMACMMAVDGTPARGLTRGSLEMLLWLLGVGVPFYGLVGVIHYYDCRRQSLYAEKLFRRVG